MRLTTLQLHRRLALEESRGRRLVPVTGTSEFDLRVADLPGYRVRVRPVGERTDLFRVEAYHPHLRPREWYRGQRIVNQIFGDRP